MKLVKTIILGLAIVTATLFVGCTQSSTPDGKMMSKEIDDKALGLRADLFSEENVIPDITKYSEAVAGTGILIERAFQFAPPMISHSVEGMFPIKADNNACLTCHIPGVAETLNTFPYPQSHMTDFRPRDMLVGDEFRKAADVMKNETVMKDIGTLANARFNCDGCHAPQSEGELIENKFVADFISKDGRTKSNFIGDVILEGVNTIE